ncbi:MAG: DUF423 domain-containing protein [Verrucomicrobia bacterium]|nr:DUF423 domain-containing protein [Verrucomicrobiota bacterium]MBV8376843.1 DUF423 domain-containing protein [Verrucomicrobiota bacterium]
MSERLAKRVAAFLGFFGVLFGAFGAHLLSGRLGESGTTAIWQTGVLYHLLHAVVLLVLSGWRPVPRTAYNLILAGVGIFSGSLYILALTNIKWFGAITPLGGLCMLAGWLVLAFQSAEGAK